MEQGHSTAVFLHLDVHTCADNVDDRGPDHNDHNGRDIEPH